MLIVRGPLRISLAGGGTDLPAYYERHGGLVVSAAIARYSYAMIELTGRPGLQISSSDYQQFFRHPPGRELLWDGKLSLPRAILQRYGITNGVELFLASEVPPGTGLGSSSTVTVTIIKALATLTGRELTKQQLAEEACAIELDTLGLPIGKQDQYAAAFGGINVIRFTSQGASVEPLVLSRATRYRLERSLMLFYTGQRHNSAAILAEQRRSSQRSSGPVVRSLHEIKQLAEETRDALECGRPDRLGELLHANWERKKRLASGITTTAIDTAYHIAREHGALGGKITGAGGGGFLMLYCSLAAQDAVTLALEAQGLTRMDFHFDGVGARVLLNSARRASLLALDREHPGAAS